MYISGTVMFLGFVAWIIWSIMHDDNAKIADEFKRTHGEKRGTKEQEDHETL